MICRNIFVSAILIGLGPNFGFNNNFSFSPFSSSSSSSSSGVYVVSADITCNTEFDFHTWENATEQRNIPDRKTLERISTILLETFNVAYNDSKVRMKSDIFASYKFERDDPVDVGADADADTDTDTDVNTDASVGIHLEVSRLRRSRTRSRSLAVTATEVGGGLRRRPSNCRTTKCRQEELRRMLSRNHLETRYSYCGHTCDNDDDASSIVIDTDIDMVDDDDTTVDMDMDMDMYMDFDIDTRRTIDFLLLNGDSEDDEDDIDDDESFPSLSYSTAHKKWEYLACKMVKDEINDYSYSTIEDCSVILTNCGDDEFKNEDTENYIMKKKKNGETYIVTDKRDIEDADILYTFTKLIE